MNPLRRITRRFGTQLAIAAGPATEASEAGTARCLGTRVCALLLVSSAAVAAQPADLVGAPTNLPSFAELEAAGARIGHVRIHPRNIFYTADPAEDRALFRLANTLHIVSRPQVIERSVLFATGQPVSVQRIEETERLLRAKRFLYDVQVRPAALRDGVVDIEVLTRDTW